MDIVLIIETSIVAIIVLLQFLVFFRNTAAVKKLASIFPEVQFLQLKLPTSAELEQATERIDTSLVQIEDNPSFSETFREIIQTTNSYLTKNSGAAESETLQQLAERKVESQERAIEANITLPLYIGLLCTFTGVIIGLIKIGIVGVTDEAIQSFIGGVLTGMIGSATGLALTVRSNYRFKEGKKQRDHAQYDYFTFLRNHIVPPLKKETEEPLSSLRHNLAAFNESFAQYQQHTNESLGESLRLFSEIKDAVGQLKTLEQGLVGIGNFLQANDGLIEKQVDYLDTYTQKAEALTQKLARHYAYADLQLEAYVAENIKAIDEHRQTAYQKVDQYLAVPQNGNRYHNGVNGINGANLSHNPVNGHSQQLQSQHLEINKRLLEQLKKDRYGNEELKDELRLLNTRLAEVAAKGEKGFMNSREFKFFIYLGMAAFMGSMLGGIISFVNTFLS